MPGRKAGKEKVAVITGGGTGIGLATARLFAHSGYSVIITGRDAKRLKRAADNIVKKNGQVIWLEIFGNSTLFGGQTALIGTMVDITGKKAAHDELGRDHGPIHGARLSEVYAAFL